MRFPTLFGVLLFLTLRCELCAEQAIISEFQALNKRTLLNNDGEGFDWIEIRNLATEPLDLQGWYLTDDRKKLRKWSFPKAVVDPGEFFVVRASGKDRRTAESEFHTNFKLSSKGEFLALVKPDGHTIVHSYPKYPQQTVDVSYGVGNDGKPAFFAEPSPGRTNSQSSIGLVAGPKFSKSRGFHHEPFRLELTSKTPNAEIRYTLDGSEPTRDNGVLYKGTISIETTTVVRARTFAKGFLPSASETHTYLFLRDVAQGNRPAGYPDTWKGKSDFYPADYEMDPEITEHPRYGDQIDDALLAVPTISLVTDITHLFDVERGIYQNPKGEGREWERPVSVEWILPDGRKGIQVNAGVRIQGNGSRQPKKSPKHSFRLVFRKIYGPGRLRFPIFDDGRATEEFDTLILRAEYNQSWIHRNDSRERAQFVRDQWMKDTQRAMGHPSTHLTYAHLYLNGIYWGLYTPNERATAEFAAAYEGGKAKDYDATNSGKPIDGSLNGYERAFRLAVGDDPAKDDVYEKLRRVVDVDALIDYMILNQYAGNRDRDSHNWYSINRSGGGGLQYISWDAESVLVDVNDNRLSLDEEDSPSGLFRRMMRNADFARKFADRVQRHLFGSGILTSHRGQQRYERRASQVFEAVVAESARWGDYRRDVHKTPEYPAPLLERDVHWITERDRVLNEVFPNRTAIVLQQYREQGYYPTVNAPQFSQHGGTIPEAFDLVISAPAGHIYYTLDGNDPIGDGGPSSNALRGASSEITVRLTKATRVKARVLADGNWSALTEGLFTRSGGLRVSELMFHAAGEEGTKMSSDDAFDFIELTNVAQHTLDLSGVRIKGAVKFSFKEGTRLAPGEVAVLVDDEVAFRKRYGVKSKVLGVYKGRLSNAGEELTIVGSMGERILQLAYKDHWYPSADGEGSSLVFRDLTAEADMWSLRESWRASATTGGSPKDR